MTNLHDQQQALEEMAERNDHAGIQRMFSGVAPDSAWDLLKKVIGTRLENHPVKAESLLEQYESARYDNERKAVIHQALAFITADGLSALVITDSLSVIFSELVNMAGGLGAFDHSAFQAVMDGKASSDPEINREAAERRIGSLRNTLSMMGAIGGLVADGAEAQNLDAAGNPGIKTIVFDENDPVVEVAKELGQEIEDHLIKYFGNDTPSQLAHMWFLAGWTAASMYLFKDERLARGFIRTYLETKFS